MGEIWVIEGRLALFVRITKKNKKNKGKIQFLKG